MIQLPAPAYDAKYDLNQALQHRRSFREYRDQPLSLAEIGQLLWAGQGVTTLGGALYPLEAYVVAGQVEDLAAGIYKYDPKRHTLQKKHDGDRREQIAAASLDQHWMARGAAMIAFAAAVERTTSRYGERGSRYVFMEAGHAAENVLLEAVALNLGALVVASFSDEEVKKLLALPANEEPLCLVPVGKK